MKAVVLEEAFAQQTFLLKAQLLKDAYRGEIRSGNMGFDAMKLVVLKAKCNDGLQRLGHEALVPRGFGEHIAQHGQKIILVAEEATISHYGVFALGSDTPAYALGVFKRRRS